jgi:hypothetical protein
MAFVKKLQGIIGKGIAASKQLANRVGGKANELAEKGALKIESAQMKSNLSKLLERLGNEVYHKLVDMDKDTVSRENPLMRELLDEIKDLRSRMALKEKEYHAIGEKAAVKT